MKPQLLALLLTGTSLVGCIGDGADDDLASSSVPDVLPPITFTQRVDFPNPIFPAQFGTTCAEKTDGDVGCGLDEPSIVVDARGWIYYTAACCFLVSSPVFVSKDGGATFEALAHPLKDAYGNEGDLAIDDEGNLYYMDIDLATFGIAVWDSDLNPVIGYRRPGEPLVDRPWIRAGQGGVVHAIYNTGSSTVYYRSTDHAMTFSALPVATFPSALAGGFSDVKHDLVGMNALGRYMLSTDAGVTWGEPTEVAGCDDVEDTFYELESAAVDEAGTVWFARTGCVVGLRLDGTWTAESWAIPEWVTPFFSWAGAGAAHGVALGFYGQVTDDAKLDELGLDADGWYLFLSTTVDGGTHWTTALADAEPLGFGELGRRLGDFMGTAVGPDGRVHIAYSRNPEMDDSATASYIGTSVVPGLAPSAPLVGPPTDADRGP